MFNWFKRLKEWFWNIEQTAIAFLSDLKASKLNNRNLIDSAMRKYEDVQIKLKRASLVGIDLFREQMFFLETDVYPFIYNYKGEPVDFKKITPALEDLGITVLIDAKEKTFDNMSGTDNIDMLKIRLEEGPIEKSIWIDCAARYEEDAILLSSIKCLYSPEDEGILRKIFKTVFAKCIVVTPVPQPEKEPVEEVIPPIKEKLEHREVIFEKEARIVQEHLKPYDQSDVTITIEEPTAQQV